MDNLYAPSSYDENFCLKPPLIMWLGMFYLSRAFTLPIAMAIGTYAGVNGDAINMFRDFWAAQTLIPSTISALVLVATVRRHPSASAPVRWIWARGRFLLVASAVIDLGLSMLAPMRLAEISDQTLLSIGASVVDLFFLVYFLAARRIKDTFAEFPLPLESRSK
jgi:hypothetical protein